MLRLPSLAVLVAFASAAPSPAAAQSADVEGVRRAALDYIEGFYEGDSTKLIRSVRPEVYKYGFSRRGTDSTYRGTQMAWPAFLEFAGNVLRSGRPAPATAPKGVQVLDVLDQTAAVKITAYWGTDYLLLGRFEGRWMITHVLWQSPPPGAANAPRPAAVPRDGMAQLAWIVGRWRGSGGGYAAFFEQYDVVDDSTMRRYTFRDSTFTAIEDSARFEFRGGRLTQVRGGRGFPAILFARDSVQFAPASGPGNTSRWVRLDRDNWRAVIQPADPARAPVVYLLRRVR